MQELDFSQQCPRTRGTNWNTRNSLWKHLFFFLSHYSAAERGPWDWLCRLPWGGHTRRELSWAWVFHPFCRAPDGQWRNAGVLLASWLPVNTERFSHNSLTDNICDHLAIVRGCLWEISLPQWEHAQFFSRPDGHPEAISSNLTCALKGNAPQCRWGPDSLFGPAWVSSCSFPKLQVCKCFLFWKCFCALLPPPCPHIYPPHSRAQASWCVPCSSLCPGREMAKSDPRGDWSRWWAPGSAQLEGPAGSLQDEELESLLMYIPSE